MSSQTHDLSATRSLIPSMLAGYARDLSVLGTRWGFGDKVTVWTANPPADASDHLLREIGKQWRHVKERSLAAYKDMELWQVKAQRARTPKSRERAIGMCQSYAAEYARRCKECDLLDEHAERVRISAATG